MPAGTGDHRSTIDGWLAVDVGAGGPESIDATYRFGLGLRAGWTRAPFQSGGRRRPSRWPPVGAGRTEERRLVERAPDELEVDGEAGA